MSTVRATSPSSLGSTSGQTAGEHGGHGGNVSEDTRQSGDLGRVGSLGFQRKVISLRKHRSGKRPLFARWYGVLSRRAERGELGKRRRALLAQASGRVLDLGVGTGESFKYLPPAVSEVVALDPDPVMLRQARRRLVDAKMPVRLVRGVGERLPCADETFDAAVVALVLCTVENLEATVAEIHRVLRPGGQLLLMEHVRATDEALAGWQDRFERPWSWLNGGCRPNRRTVEAIQAAGFRIEGLERYGFPAVPHVQGVAVRPCDPANPPPRRSAI